MDAGEVTQLASTVFAAIAAIGSAVAAWVVYRQWLSGSTPSLTIDLAQYMPSKALVLTVVNFGAPVKKVSVVVIEGDQAVMTFLPPHGFLAAGERVRMTLGLDATDGDRMTAVAYGFDLSGEHVYAWSANGQSGRWRARGRRFRGRPADLSAATILKGFYPDAADPTTLEKRAIVRHES